MAFRYLSFFQDKECKKKIESVFLGGSSHSKQEYFEGDFHSNHPDVMSSFLALGKHLNESQNKTDISPYME
jgi:peptide subunit release factor 1 (eRF1)